MQFSDVPFDPNSQINPRLFSYKGRIGRLRYFVVTLILTLISVVEEIVSGPLDQFFYILTSGAEGMYALYTAIYSGILILAGVVGIFNIIKRLHDIKMSGWWLLLFLVPFVNFIFGIYLLFKKSAYPPQGSAAQAQASTQDGTDYITIK